MSDRMDPLLRSRTSRCNCGSANLDRFAVPPETIPYAHLTHDVEGKVVLDIASTILVERIWLVTDSERQGNLRS